MKRHCACPDSIGDPDIFHVGRSNPQGLATPPIEGVHFLRNDDFLVRTVLSRMSILSPRGELGRGLTPVNAAKLTLLVSLQLQ